MARRPTSPAAGIFKRALETLDYEKLDSEINKLTSAFSPNNPYELKTLLMRYDHDFNQEYLDTYSSIYGNRWAKGEERLELGMTAEESLKHWDNVMDFCLRNGYLMFILYRQKGSSDKWKFGVSCHAFDLADMKLEEYKHLHPLSYQPWADLFDLLFVKSLGDDLTYQKYFFNNSACKAPSLNIPAVFLFTYVESVVSVHAGYERSLSIVITDEGLELYKRINVQTRFLARARMSDVYDCKENQPALRSIFASSLEYPARDLIAFCQNMIAKYDSSQKARL